MEGSGVVVMVYFGFRLYVLGFGGREVGSFEREMRVRDGPFS